MKRISWIFQIHPTFSSSTFQREIIAIFPLTGVFFETPCNTFMAKEIVSNMSCVINTEALGDDQIDARDYVYGEAPEVNKSPNINLTEYEGH